MEENTESLYPEGAVTGGAEDALQGRDVEIRSTSTEKIETKDPSEEVQETEKTEEAAPKTEEQAETKDNEDKPTSEEEPIETRVSKAVEADQTLQDELGKRELTLMPLLMSTIQMVHCLKSPMTSLKRQVIQSLLLMHTLLVLKLQHSSLSQMSISMQGDRKSMKRLLASLASRMTEVQNALILLLKKGIWLALDWLLMALRLVCTLLTATLVVLFLVGLVTLATTLATWGLLTEEKW